jgi:hypothetical protein
VIGAFTSKAKAQAFMDSVKSEYNGIEEYDLDPPAANMIARGYSVWSVLMLRSGDVERVNRTETDSYAVGEVGGDRIWERSKAPAYRGKGIPDALHSYVWAKSEKAAVKIVNERRAEMIASGKWK